MMGVLAKRTYFKQAPLTPSIYQDGLSLDEHETWMAIYHDNNKIGFTRSHITKNPEGYVIWESAVMNLRAIGQTHRISTEIVGHLNNDASLQSFVFILNSGMVRYEVRGKVEGQNMILKTRTGGETRESRIVLHEKPCLSAGLWHRFFNKGLVVGARYRFSVFDPSIMAQRPVEATVLSREELVLDGRKQEAFKVKTTFGGLDLLTWIAPNGERLKEEGLMGLQLVKTTEEEARQGIISDPDIDLTEAASIASNKILAAPSDLIYLKIRLDEINLEGLDLNTGRQRLTDSVLEVTLESTGPERQYNNKPLQPYLKAGPLIQSDHPDIISLSRKIVDGAMKDEARARLILNWVHKSLDKRATVSIPNALDTLQTRTGDCNEHAMLFSALLRAAGVPAKVCVGLVYTRGRFYYHAWNEVFLGKWIPADALMGQMPADVTHIKFVEGGLDRQAEMVRVIGHVKLTVLEAR